MEENNLSTYCKSSKYDFLRAPGLTLIQENFQGTVTREDPNLSLEKEKKSVVKIILLKNRSIWMCTVLRTVKLL